MCLPNPSSSFRYRGIQSVPWVYPLISRHRRPSRCISINASSSVSDFNPSVILSFLRADTLWSNPHRTDWNSLYNLRMSTTANLPKAILVELDEFLRKRAEATVLERQFMTLRRNGNNLQETLTFLALGITLLPRDEALSLIARTSLPIKSMSHHKLAKILQDAPDSDAFLGMRATVMGQALQLLVKAPTTKLKRYSVVLNLSLSLT